MNNYNKKKKITITQEINKLLKKWLDYDYGGFDREILLDGVKYPKFRHDLREIMKDQWGQGFKEGYEKAFKSLNSIDTV